MALRGRVWGAGKILVLAGALVATFFICAAVAMRVAIRAREVTVPELAGRTLADATAVLNELDLSLRVEPGERPDARMPAGRILGQEPAAGSGSRRLRAVKVWISAGPREVRVPRLLGESERTAQIRLAQEGLDAAQVAEIRSNDYPPDVVVAQDPAPAAAAADVHLLVNRGQDLATYVMPDLIGLNGDRAADVLRGQGFRVSTVSQQASGGLPPGVVVRQTPAAGYQVHPGDAISIEVSR
jgi:beta-lactam-binding protein with PASTA domain